MASKLSHAVVHHLIDNGVTITCMESCTSGLIASTITDVEGASAIFKGSLVTYSNEAKVRYGVPAEVIATYGVYSPECARAMATVAQEAFGTELSIGITGSTGNVDPANADSVSGQVFYCIRCGNESHDYFFGLNTTGMARDEIKRAYVTKVFESLATLLSRR